MYVHERRTLSLLLHKQRRYHIFFTLYILAVVYIFHPRVATANAERTNITTQIRHTEKYTFYLPPRIQVYPADMIFFYLHTSFLYEHTRLS